MISGINVGNVIEEYAGSVINQNNEQIFSHFPKAVKVSNHFKSKKFVNVGLLEFMFVTIKVRLTFKKLEEALNGFISVLKNTPKSDIKDEAEAFKIAWSTSKNETKKAALNEVEMLVNKVDNFYERRKLSKQIWPDPLSAGYQVSEEYLQGFPTIRRYISEIDETKGLIKSIEDSYNKMHRENLDFKVGVLADLSAAAIFLYLSFQDPDTYIIK